MKPEERFEVRDIRKKEQFVVDDAYLNGYAEFCGIYATGVYVSLCRYVDISSQSCFPSITLISRRLKISRSQVIRALRALEDYNIIRREKTHGKGNRYWLIDKKHWKPAGVPQTPVPARHQCLTETGSCQTPTGSHQTPVPVSDRNSKDSYIRIHNKDVKYIPSPESESIPYEEIISHLNARVGASYRHERPKTRQLIKARWKEGFRSVDFVTVIDNMAASWGENPEMRNYLRPETLFSNKFESYLNWKTGGSNGNNGTNKHDGSGVASTRSGNSGKYAGIGEVLKYE